MTKDLRSAAASLTSLLGLEHEPVAITFHDIAPNGASKYFDAAMSVPTEDGRSGRVAAPCVFWMHGHESTFATLPADHGNCSVGQFTHGLAEAADILGKSDVAARARRGMGDFGGFRRGGSTFSETSGNQLRSARGVGLYSFGGPASSKSKADDGDRRRRAGGMVRQASMPNSSPRG
jgi:hypothetical protein